MGHFCVATYMKINLLIRSFSVRTKHACPAAGEVSEPRPNYRNIFLIFIQVVLQVLLSVMSPKQVNQSVSIISKFTINAHLALIRWEACPIKIYCNYLVRAYATTFIPCSNAQIRCSSPPGSHLLPSHAQLRSFGQK